MGWGEGALAAVEGLEARAADAAGADAVGAAVVEVGEAVGSMGVESPADSVALQEGRGAVLAEKAAMGELVAWGVATGVGEQSHIPRARCKVRRPCTRETAATEREGAGMA